MRSGVLSLGYLNPLWVIDTFLASVCYPILLLQSGCLEKDYSVSVSMS